MEYYINADFNSTDPDQKDAAAVLYGADYSGYSDEQLRMLSALGSKMYEESYQYLIPVSYTHLTLPTKRIV